ncbi:histidine-type phosphatase [Sphingomonadaceae bacterium jetA1]|jgi:4-phytase/acid phosphatase|uniref:histidine-type phosphatase n=1 Tax=Facivitalis istanbulensis TaxID=3075838 RepID=UPI00346A77DB
MAIRLRRWLAVGAALWSGAASAQPVEHLERVVIVMRHGVRSAMSSPEELGEYSARPWPRFAVPAGHLTDDGARAVTLLGDWYRRHYRAVGLLADGDCAVYYWANHTQRTEATATALARGLTPNCPATIHQSPAAPDPLFDAPMTPLARLDPARRLAAISGRIGGDLAGWDRRQQPGLDRFEAILLQCERVPCTPAERRRPRRRLADTPIRMALDSDGDVTLTSPALQVAGIAESLLMAYADGLAFKGWRGIDAKSIEAAMTVHGAGIDLRTRTQEVGRQASGYLATRILATLQSGNGRGVAAEPIGGTEKIVVLSGHDGTVTMLAGLLGLEWQVPGYAAGQAAPGGGLVFERWRRASGEAIVRVRYIAQGLDQLRALTPLTGDAVPGNAAVFVPGCSEADMACPLEDFGRRVMEAQR